MHQPRHGRGWCPRSGRHRHHPSLSGWRQARRRRQHGSGGRCWISRLPAVGCGWSRWRARCSPRRGGGHGPSIFPLPVRSPLVLCRRHPLGCVRFGPGVGRCKPRFTESEAPPVQPSPCRCAPAPLPSSGPSASAYARPQGTAPEGADAGTAPAAPPGQRKKDRDHDPEIHTDQRAARHRPQPDRPPARHPRNGRTPRPASGPGRQPRPHLRP